MPWGMAAPVCALNLGLACEVAIIPCAQSVHKHLSAGVDSGVCSLSMAHVCGSVRRADLGAPAAGSVCVTVCTQPPADTENSRQHHWLVVLPSDTCSPHGALSGSAQGTPEKGQSLHSLSIGVCGQICLQHFATLPEYLNVKDQQKENLIKCSYAEFS